MKKIHLGQSLSILANLGVLVSILLLAYELNQNRQMMRSQVRNEVSTGVVTLLVATVNDPNFADVRVRGGKGEELTEVERSQFRLYVNAWLRTWENAYYQYKNGLYDEQEFAGQREAWRRTFAQQRGFVNYFCANRTEYSAEFASEIDALLTTNDCG
jgi:hypothetical protein